MMTRQCILAVALLLATTASAFADDVRTERRVIQSPEMAELNLPFSEAVLVGNTLYISGSGGFDTETMTVPEDPKEEARLLMETFKSILERADMTMDDLVYVTVYCPDLSLYADFNEVYRSYFKGDYPARAFVGSAPLLFGMRFEMQGIAVK